MQLPPDQRWFSPEEITSNKQGSTKRERRSDCPKSSLLPSSPRLLPKLSSFLHKDLKKCGFKAKRRMRGASEEWNSSRRLAAVAEEQPGSQATSPHQKPFLGGSWLQPHPPRKTQLPSPGKAAAPRLCS